MTVTVEIANLTELEKIVSFLKSMQLENIKVVSNGAMLLPKIQKGDKKINPKDLFGMWKNSPKDIESIRAMAWERTKKQ